MTRCRILVQAASPPGRGGGSEQTVREMVRGLRSMRYDVQVFGLESSLPRWLEAGKRSERFLFGEPEEAAGRKGVGSSAP